MKKVKDLTTTKKLMLLWIALISLSVAIYYVIPRFVLGAPSCIFDFDWDYLCTDTQKIANNFDLARKVSGVGHFALLAFSFSFMPMVLLSYLFERRP